MIECLPYLAIAACTATLEIGWVSSVRSVTQNRVWMLAANAALMQAISNASMLILVSDRWTATASVFGAAVGAVIALRSRLLSLFAV